MKKFLALIPLFFIVAGFLFTSSVFAQATETPVNTPTITAPAPYQPDINLPSDLEFVCLPTPQKPVGWLTITPSSSWELLCGDCYADELPTSTAKPTDTPIPQATWNGTGTPEATWTATITPSPTYTMTPTATQVVCNTPSGGVYEWTYGNMVFQNFHSNNSSFGEWSCNVPINGFTDVLICDYHAWGHYDGSDGGYYPYGFIYFGGVRTSNAIIHTRYSVVSTSGVLLDSCPDGSRAFDYVGQCNHNVPDEPGTAVSWTIKYIANAISHNWDIVVRVEVADDDLYQPYVCNTPTPTVTPEATPTLNLSSYCAVVSDTSMDDSLFSYSGIVSHGTPSCFDLGPSEGFDFWGLGTEKLFEYPWLAHICLQDIDIGVLTIFGVSLSLHIVAYVVGIAMIVRNMFVS